MTLARHELRQGRTALLVWSAAISLLMAVCVLLYPEMEGNMENVGDMFSSMGSFSAAFGMNQVDFGALEGFYAVECGNILGLGGAFFAALCAITALEKEERGHTAEFLLAHPISRQRILSEKLAASLAQVALLNLAVLAVSSASLVGIGKEVPWKGILLVHLAYFLLQAELLGICFGISAFLRRGGMGVGLGVAAMMYFLQILANLSEEAGFLKYITPFGYAEGTKIVAEGSLDGGLILLGALYGLAGIAAAFWEYCRKDIQ